jgi:hypothetical protein
VIFQVGCVKLRQWIKSTRARSAISPRLMQDRAAKEFSRSRFSCFQDHDRAALQAGYSGRLVASRICANGGGFLDREVTSCPVNQLGWAFQVSLLAPCVLHFGHYQLLWECREVNACEIYPKDIAARLSLALDKFKIPDPEVEGDPYRLWYTYVDTYSRTALTVPGDRLVALSGIAKRFKTRTNDHYVARMWRAHPEITLLWHSYPQEGDQAITTPGQYRAPSWSWAALDGSVTNWIATEYPAKNIRRCTSPSKMWHYTMRPKILPVLYLAAGWTCTAILNPCV